MIKSKYEIISHYIICFLFYVVNQLHASKLSQMKFSFESFEYLNVYDLLNTFSNLNPRFQNQTSL
jgi:hypothetical protein